MMAHAFAEADLREVLPRIRVPTMLLCGEVDERSPLPVAEALHDAIPTSTMLVLLGLGHESYVEAPAQLTRIVQEKSLAASVATSP